MMSKLFVYNMGNNYLQYVSFGTSIPSQIEVRARHPQSIGIENNIPHAVPMKKSTVN